MLTFARRKVVAARALERILACLAPLFLRVFPVKRIECDECTVLLIEPFQLGDVLSLAVMFDPLKERFPSGRIVVWCHSRNAHVYGGDPRVYKVLHAPFPWSNRGSKRGTLTAWLEVVRSCRKMRDERPDVAIDPRGDIRSQALMSFSGARMRVGYSTYVGSNLKLRGLLLTHILPQPEETHRYRTNLIALQRLLGAVPSLRLPALVAARPAVRAPGIFHVLIHPGAGWVFKQWEPRRWAELIERLRALYAPGNCIDIRLVAGPGETALCRSIEALLTTPIHTLATDFQGLVQAIAGADLFVGLDSGPMNAAHLLNVPTVALFGPGESSLWRPLSERSAYFHPIAAYACHPCNQTVCVRPHDPCMTAIGVDEVFTAASRILIESSPGR